MRFSLIFFVFGWGVVRYMSMYVWEPKYESGGIMWLNIVDAVIYGLIMYQCTFIGLFGLKEVFGQAAAVTILPFVSYQKNLNRAGYGSITTEVKSDQIFPVSAKNNKNIFGEDETRYLNSIEYLNIIFPDLELPKTWKI